jgi:hypothetical protein
MGKRSLRADVGIVKDGYISSNKDFLKRLENGDHVIIINIDDFYDFINDFTNLSDKIKDLDDRAGTVLRKLIQEKDK